MSEFTDVQEVNTDVVIESISGNELSNIYTGWNEQILDSFELIVCDLPSHYGYIAFEDSGSYYLFTGSIFSVQDNHIYFGSDCKVAVASVSDDAITFNQVDYPDFNYSIDNSTLVYSNLITGYPDLKAEHFNMPLFLGFCIVVTSAFCFINRSSRR